MKKILEDIQYIDADVLFLQEVRLSNEALKYHLSDMASMKKDL